MKGMKHSEKESQYQLLLAQLDALLMDETNALANLSNASALLNQALPRSVFSGDRKSTRLNSSHLARSRMPSSA